MRRSRLAWLGVFCVVALPAGAYSPPTPYMATVKPLGAELPPAETAFAIGNIAIRRIAPVLYTGVEGGGINEYRVTPNGVEITIQIANPPENGDMVDVRYEPYDNIGALPAFAMIRVDRVDRDHIRLSARSYRDTPNRIRLLITAIYGAA